MSNEQPKYLKLWNTAQALPFGKRAFTMAFQRAAPYFKTLPMQFVDACPGQVKAEMQHHKKVTNHLGTVHAIALCNLAEAVMGLAAECTIPSSHRWIPKGMTVAYTAKAVGTMHAVARLDLPAVMPEKIELPVIISVQDPMGLEVFTAEIRIWVTAKKTK